MPYNINIESSLQDNYLLRWPVPFVPGNVEMNVQIHYVYLHTNSVPTNHLNSAIDYVSDLFGEHDINLNFLPIIDQAVLSGNDFLSEANDSYISMYPQNINSTALNIIIFEYELISSNVAPTNFSLLHENGVMMSLNKIPNTLMSIKDVGPFDDPQKLSVALGTSLGLQMGLLWLDFTADLDDMSALPLLGLSNNITECYRSHDFICETVRGSNNHGNGFYFDQNCCLAPTIIRGAF